MNILVTGSNGQLGNEMVRVSGNSKDRYVFTDIAELDITNLDDVLALVQKERIDVIVNCAAYTNVDKAEEDEKAADLINHVAVSYLAAAAKSVNATLIHISTDYVFKGINYLPFTEKDTTEPTGVYGKTKLAGEEAVVIIALRQFFGLSVLPGQHGALGCIFICRLICKLQIELDALCGGFRQNGNRVVTDHAGNVAPKIRKARKPAALFVHP